MSYNLFFSMSADPIPLKNCKSLHLLDLFLFHRCLVDGHYLVSWTPVFQGWHWLFLDMLVAYWVRVRGDAEHPTVHKAACATTKNFLSKPGSGFKHGNMASRFAIQNSCKWYRRSQIISGRCVPVLMMSPEPFVDLGSTQCVQTYVFSISLKR